MDFVLSFITIMLSQCEYLVDDYSTLHFPSCPFTLRSIVKSVISVAASVDVVSVSLVPSP